MPFISVMVVLVMMIVVVLAMGRIWVLPFMGLRPRRFVTLHLL